MQVRIGGWGGWVQTPALTSSKMITIVVTMKNDILQGLLSVHGERYEWETGYKTYWTYDFDYDFVSLSAIIGLETNKQKHYNGPAPPPKIPGSAPGMNCKKLKMLHIAISKQTFPVI